MTESKAVLIAKDLASKIQHQQFPAGTFLPTENQLATLYGTARETIRKALAQLNDLGLIQKIRGKGSVVLNLEKYSFPISGITSFAELNNSLKMNAQTQVLTLQKMSAAPEMFQAKFANDSVQKGIYLERLRLINDEPAVLDCDFLFTPPITDLPMAAAQTSIYNYLEQELGLEVSYATKTITVEQVTPQLQSKLQLNNNLVVLVASHSFLSDTTSFQLTLSFHNPSKFKFVDFARRKKIKL